MFLNFSLADYSYNLLTKYDHFTKHTTSAQIKTGRRLSERQISYIAQAGFSSIISAFNFTTDDTSYNGVTDTFPSSATEIALGESLGLKVIDLNSDLTSKYADIISDIILNAPKPVYIHCHVSNLFFKYLKSSML